MAVRLIVTGGSGFLGGFVLRDAVRRGYEVIALARSPAAATAVRALGAQPVHGDLAARGPAAATALAEAFASGDVLVNLASRGFGDASTIVAAAEQAQVRGAVFVATTALPAGTRQLELAAEQVIEESALDWTILRPTMIYGAPGDRNLSRLLPLLRRVPVLPVPGGARLQQPVHVGDVAHAVLAAAELISADLMSAEVAGAEAKPGGVTYDLAGPVPLTFDELLRTAGQAVGSRTRFIPVPLPPVLVPQLAEHKAFAVHAAARDLGFAPRSFADGIRSEARALGLAA